jgi:large subunit ribosomal protein L28
MCNKAVQFGHNVSHSKVRTNRRWLPNIQQATIFEDGKPRTVKICTKCLKQLRKKV